MILTKDIWNRVFDLANFYESILGNSEQSLVIIERALECLKTNTQESRNLLVRFLDDLERLELEGDERFYRVKVYQDQLGAVCFKNEIGSVLVRVKDIDKVIGYLKYIQKKSESK